MLRIVEKENLWWDHFGIFSRATSGVSEKLADKEMEELCFFGVLAVMNLKNRFLC
jgi:hypothetical protein